MNRVTTKTLGCKVNYADTQALAGMLPESLERPVRIIATCCVTAEGEKQSRKEVRRAANMVGAAGTVFVTGCAARLRPEAFKALGDNVEVVTGAPTEAAAVIAGLRGGDTAAEEPAAARGRTRTRFFLKVQDGCDKRCSYCVVPLVRGDPRSIPKDMLLEQARRLVAAGYPELVVNGINVGAYRDGAIRLSGLLRSFAAIDGLKRLRLSSIEVTDLTDDLLALMGGEGRLARHLHVPLQSGDDRVLAAMKRRYNRRDFAQRLAKARAAIPGVNLTTDVIVGFPGEDEEAFKRTLAFIEQTGFTRVHVFPFSSRPGTAAARLPERISVAEKRERSLAARELSLQLQRQHWRRKVGDMSEVLLESADGDGYAGGYSSDYTRFTVASSATGEIVRVLGEGLAEDGVCGKVI